MSFDMGNVLKDMVGSVSDVVSDESGNIAGDTKSIFERQKALMEELALALIDGLIDQEEFDEELQREKKVIEAELLTLQVMTKVMVQEAVNVAMNVFVNAVKVAI
ncbi:MAG: hypothetical protein GY714_15080 [Desulfobacterales bacterium]|nr:hypothetical protein [Desulfobacterales bacterium]MCP4162124.1 hypothetical protein [Deltaproteobacteria bacterium]